MDFFEKLFDKAIEFAMTAGVRLIGAILIVIIGFMIVNKVTKAIKKGKHSEKIDKSALDFIISFANIALKIIIVLTAANYLGVPMTNVVAIIGSCGLAVGLALQGSLSNLAGGIMILIFKPCKDGDFISVNGLEGTVKEITILYTYLITPDNKTIVIPNATISNSAITNYSTSETRRVDVTIGVSYKSDIVKVRELLLEYAKGIENVEKDPEPAVVVAYGDSAVNMTIRAWVKNENYWPVAGEINLGLQKLLADNGIEIPYPQLDVHLDK
ncbi:MAG: mechanosensitive ion channel [Ruminococcaceae bacterium]|nr:mechanosensitive ion channel [Oscillospiraceae bacterium]